MRIFKKIFAVVMALSVILSSMMITTAAAEEHDHIHVHSHSNAVVYEESALAGESKTITLPFNNITVLSGNISFDDTVTIDSWEIKNAAGNVVDKSNDGSALEFFVLDLEGEGVLTNYKFTINYTISDEAVFGDTPTVTLLFEVFDEYFEMTELEIEIINNIACASHVYDNDCDADCNVCGATRTVGDHVYDNACDTDCNVCGATRTTSHTYLSNCDKTCNVCGATRTTSVDHTYDNCVDTTCNACGETRTAPGHTYDDD